MSGKLIEELRANAAAHPLDVRQQVLADAAAALESQAREIERLEAWKAEELTVMNPLMDYARSACTGPLGCSLPEWLFDDHKAMTAKVDEQAREIERQSRLIDGANTVTAALMEELTALKARTSGVVLPEPDFYWVEADEGSWNSPEEWAQDYYDYNGEKPESVTFSCSVELPKREYDSFEFDADGGCISCRLVNPKVGRLNSFPGSAALTAPAPGECVAVPVGCRQRLAAEGKAYPKSSCAVCGQFSPKWKECAAILAQQSKAVGDE